MPRQLLLPSHTCLLTFASSDQKIWSLAEDALDLLQLFRKQLASVSETLAFAIVPGTAVFIVSFGDEEVLFKYFKNEGKFPEENETLEGIRALNKQLSAQQFNVFDRQLYKLLTGLFTPEKSRKIQLTCKTLSDDTETRHEIIRIHHLPVITHCCASPANWKFSSYQAVLSDAPTALQRDKVLSLFGTRENFSSAHSAVADQTYSA
ncbi:MAG: hypothetical protein ACK5CV_02825 [Bacteroidota bacterium]|jgi:putative transposase